MTADHTGGNTAANNDKNPGHDSRDLDPRDTDHPTGTSQAAENAANESPA